MIFALIGFVFLVQHSPLGAQTTNVTLTLDECQPKHGPWSPDRDQINVINEFHSCINNQSSSPSTFSKSWIEDCVSKNGLNQTKPNQVEALSLTKNCTEAYYDAAVRLWAGMSFNPTGTTMSAYRDAWIWTIMKRVMDHLEQTTSIQSPVLPPSFQPAPFKEECQCSAYGAAGQCKLCARVIQVSPCQNANFTQQLQDLQVSTETSDTVPPNWDRQLCDTLWNTSCIVAPSPTPCNSTGCHLNKTTTDVHILEDILGWPMDYLSMLQMQSINKGCQSAPPASGPVTPLDGNTTNPWGRGNGTLIPTSPITTSEEQSSTSFIEENMELVIGLGCGCICLLIVICAVCMTCCCGNSDKPIHDAALANLSARAPPVNQTAAPIVPPYNPMQASERSYNPSSSASRSAATAPQGTFPMQHNYPPYPYAPQPPSGSYRQAPQQPHYGSYAPYQYPSTPGYPPQPQAYGFSAAPYPPPAAPPDDSSTSGDSTSERSDRSRRR